MKLLIVDDNPHIIKIIHQLLKERFDEIFECSDVLTAVRIFEENQPEWVVMDIEMPEIDGLAGVRMIKNKYPNSRIIMVSKFQDKEIVDFSKYVGADAFFSKDDLSKLNTYFESWGKYN